MVLVGFALGHGTHGNHGTQGTAGTQGRDPTASRSWQAAR
jgi:hypothetical protein